MDQSALLPDDKHHGVPLHQAGAESLPVRFRLGDPLGRPNEEQASGGMLDYWRIARRYRGLVVLIAFLGSLAAFLWTLPQTPVYQARTSLEIQAINENFLNMAAINQTAVGSASYGDTDIQTQVKILQSQSLTKRVVAKLKLEENPDFIYEPTRESAWRKALGLPAPEPVSARKQALAMAASNLKVRGTLQTRIVEVFCDSTSPKLAADFANTLAQEFIEQSVESRWNATQRTGEWLTRQMEDLRIKLERSEQKLQDYAQTSGLMFTSEKDKDSVAEARLRQLQEELSKAQADRMAKQVQYEMASKSSPDSLPGVLEDPSLREYQDKLTELRSQVAELTTSLTPAHVKVKRVQMRIAEMESALEKQRTNILKRIRNEHESALRREHLLSTSYAAQSRLVSAQSEKGIHYGVLKREVDTSRQLYEAVLQKVKEAGIASAMRASNVTVVDPAEPPSSPYKPEPVRNAFWGFGFGAVLGMAVAFMLERADRSLKSPGDATYYLNVPELGVIPATNRHSVGRPRGKVRLILRNKSASANGHKTGTNGTGANGTGTSPSEEAHSPVEMSTWKHKSIMAESFRAALTSILYSGKNGDRPRILVISSPIPGEGKTTAVSNLGIAMAEIRHRVLLIDADMRRPRLHKIFSVDNSRGLSDLLCESDSIEHASLAGTIQPTAIKGLSVLPSGPRTSSIPNLLHSPRLRELIERVRRDYDEVLIDTPPMLQIPDARVVASLADAAILVFRAGQTSRDVALAAKQRFAEDGTRVLGTILNSWDPILSQSTYYSGYYNGYYKGLYSRYYSTESPEAEATANTAGD